MKQIHRGFRLGMLAAALLALIGSAVLTPATVEAAGGKSGGGGGGGGGGSVTESRVTGYVTAIDYTAKTVQIGASYYGSGQLKVTSDTKISLNNINATFSDVKLGQWCEARYDFATKIATKLSNTGN